MRSASLILVVLLSSCGEKPSSMQDLASTEVVFPNRTKIMAETVQQQLDLMRGLMFRESLDPNRGMLFVYRKEDFAPIWMYQTKIPLDIIWADRDHRIVEISANTPPCASKSARGCPYYGGHRKAQFVLEVNAGIAAKNGLKVGDALDF